jgi:hypothetical protein
LQQFPRSEIAFRGWGLLGVSVGHLPVGARFLVFCTVYLPVAALVDLAPVDDARFPSHYAQRWHFTQAKRTAPAPAPAGPPMNGASQYVPPMAGPLAALSAVAAASNYGGMQGPPEGMPPQMAPQPVAGGMAGHQITPQQYQQMLAAQAYIHNGGMPMQGGMYGMPPRGPPPAGPPGPAPGAH